MKLKKMPSKKRLRQLFEYRKGHLYWKVNRGRNYIKGKKAGSYNGRGYRSIGIEGLEYFEHRLIWAWHYGPIPEFIDHRNQNKADNRIRNLRPASKTHNEWHTGKRKNNTTGFKGVFKIKFGCPQNPYWAYITINGKRKGLGFYPSAKKAALAYNKAANRMHGKFACLN